MKHQKYDARDKDVTLQLLKAYGFEYENRGSAGPGTLNKGVNMVKTDMKMQRIAKKFKPDVNYQTLRFGHFQSMIDN